MTMTHQNGNGGSFEALTHMDSEVEITRVDATAVAALNRSDVEAQLDAAHRYPRSVKRFLSESLTLATLTRDVAEACIYALPRGGKTISGPSVRLAEIVASSYGNIHVAARVVAAEDKEVVAQGVAWDLERNLRVTVEARRRITNRQGKRFDDDMITMTGNAAASIALRNAIFRVVPRAYVDSLYAKIREVAVGDAKTLSVRRMELVARLQKIGVPLDRILPRVEKASIEDVGLEEVEILIGLGTAIKNGDRSIDEAFPPPEGETSAKARSLEDKLRAPKAPPASTPKVDADGVVQEPAKAAEPPLPDWATATVDPIATRGRKPKPEPKTEPAPSATSTQDSEWDEGRM